MALESSRRGARAEAAVAPSVLAAVAVHAAGQVPGVVRVEPGVAGLVTSALRTARQRIKGLAPAPTEGARVTAGTPPQVEVGVAVRGQAMAVGHAVQAAVTDELASALGVTDVVVAVSILDIELPVVAP